MLYLGIYDLSFSLGFEGNVNHVDLIDTLVTTLKKIKRAGKFLSLMAQTEMDMKKYIGLGAEAIVCGVDTNIYHSAIKNKITQFRNQGRFFL